MPGGKIQLLAYNENNKYISGNPQITFFKSLFKKHTNFALETIEQTLTGNMTLGNIMECKIDKYAGDLLSDIYLEIDVNINDNFYNNISLSMINYGHNIIDYIEFEIGGLLIDKHYGKWLQIWNELTDENDMGVNGITCYDTNKCYSNMFTKTQMMSGIGIHKILDNAYINPNNDNNLADSNDDKDYYSMNYRKYPGGNTYYLDANGNIRGKLFIPFKFWFCNKPGLALPLLSILYDDVIVRIKLNESNNIYDLDTNDDSNFDFDSNLDYATPTIFNEDTNLSNHINQLGIVSNDSNIGSITDNSKYKLWCDYIFLDEEEKNKFLYSNHQYLIEQIQYKEESVSTTNGTINNSIIDLTFNHTVKELIWTFQRNTPLYYTEFLSLGDHEGSIQLLINKNSRFEEQNVLYFTRYQPYMYHSGRGGVNYNDSIFVYSFSLYPEKYQPSGICNFSDIQVQLELNDIKIVNDDMDINIHIYAINYNILKISGGSIKLLYGK